MDNDETEKNALDQLDEKKSFIDKFAYETKNIVFSTAYILLNQEVFNHSIRVILYIIEGLQFLTFPFHKQVMNI